MFFPPFPEEEISDYIAHGPFIRVFTVYGGFSNRGKAMRNSTRILTANDQAKTAATIGELPQRTGSNETYG